MGCDRIIIANCVCRLEIIRMIMSTFWIIYRYHARLQDYASPIKKPHCVCDTTCSHDATCPKYLKQNGNFQQQTCCNILKCTTRLRISCLPVPYILTDSIIMFKIRDYNELIRAIFIYHATQMNVMNNIVPITYINLQTFFWTSWATNGIIQT